MLVETVTKRELEERRREMIHRVIEHSPEMQRRGVEIGLDKINGLVESVSKGDVGGTTRYGIKGMHQHELGGSHL